MFLLLGCVITLSLQGCVIAQWVALRDCAMFLLLGCVITLCLQDCVIAKWLPCVITLCKYLFPYGKTLGDSTIAAMVGPSPYSVTYNVIEPVKMRVWEKSTFK
jgi:hypothetical protein